MNNCFVVLAAGNSRRFKSEIPKQFSKINGVMMLDYSVNTALKSKLFDRILIVINKNQKNMLKILVTKKLKLYLEVIVDKYLL